MFQNQPFIDTLQVFSNNSQKSLKKPVLESLFNTVVVLRTCKFIKKDSNTGVVLWDLPPSNNYFEEHMWTSASKLYLKGDSNIGFFLWILWIIQKHLFCRGSTNGWFWNTGGLSSIKLQAWWPEGIRKSL